MDEHDTCYGCGQDYSHCECEKVICQFCHVVWLRGPEDDNICPYCKKRIILQKYL